MCSAVRAHKQEITHSVNMVEHIRAHTIYMYKWHVCTEEFYLFLSRSRLFAHLGTLIYSADCGCRCRCRRRGRSRHRRHCIYFYSLS